MNPGPLVIPVLLIVSLGSAAAGVLSHARAEATRQAAGQTSEIGGTSPRGPAAGAAGPGSSASGTAAARPRPPERNYNHPMLFDRVAPTRPADCSAMALDGVIGMARELQKSARTAATTQAKAKDAHEACSEDPNASERAPVVEDLESRVSGCVGQDSPLDDRWDSVSSALQAIASCLDCGAATATRQSRCKHADALLTSAGKPTKPTATAHAIEPHAQPTKLGAP